MERYNFICVNFNGQGFTKDLHNSLKKMIVPIGVSIRLIIVDNNSDKKDLLELRGIIAEKVDVELIELESNIGYFPAMNVGIEFAKTSKEEKIIIGNNDLIYDKNFLVELINLEYQENTLVISPDVVTLDGVHQNPLSTKKLTKLEILKEDIYYSNYYVSRLLITLKRCFSILTGARKIKPNHRVNTNMVINRGIGACYYLTDAFFRHYKLLDDRVFMWGEEALLSNQVQKVGGVILYAPALVVQHVESGTVKKMLTKKRYNIVKNSYKIYREYL